MVNNTEKGIISQRLGPQETKLAEKLVFLPKNTPKWWNIWVTSENGFFGYLNFDLEPKKGVKCENWRLFRNYGILKV